MTISNNADARPSITGAGTPASRQVNWYETFRYASRIAAQHGVVLEHRDLPVPGTVQWCGLPDDDARKLLSLLLGGIREALINDARQVAIAEAGEEISAAENWSKVSRDVQRRRHIDDLRKAS